MKINKFYKGLYPSVARVEQPQQKSTNISRPGDRNPNNPNYKLKTRGRFWKN